MENSIDNLVFNVVKLYQSAQNSYFPHSRVIRARKHSISSKVEDLFANFIANCLRQELNFLIDKILFIGKIKVSPDISIFEKDVLLNIIDLKTDLGWKRNDFIKYCKDMNEKIKQIHGAVFDLNSTKIRVSKYLKYHIVIISDANIKKSTFLDIENNVKALPYVTTTTLVRGVHPNSNAQSINEFKVNSAIGYPEIKNLINELNTPE